MSFEPEKRTAARMLDAIENASLDLEDARGLYEEADPALVYLLFAWLRDRYRHHSAAEGVLGRIVELCQRSPITAQFARDGERDSIAQWFEETHEYRDFDRDDFISTIVEKLEG
ncbi:MAG: hypothetical protein AAF211_19480 [Myxococcota bacterium]